MHNIFAQVKKNDIIVIGAGLGGLECGMLLSKRGYSVLLLEAQAQPGGCMQSYSRRGNHYDTGLHYVGGLREGEALHEAFKELGLLDLPWQHLDPEAFDKVTIGGETFSFHEGFDEFAYAMSQRFPKEKAGLQQYVDMLRHCNDADEMHADVNAWQWMHETFSDELLISVLSGTSLKMELRKETLPLFTFAHGNSSFIESSWRLKGPGNMLVEKLVEGIRSNGGEVVCNAQVTELIETDGKLTAAVCSNGERYEADIFISNAHPATTCNLVKDSKIMKGLYRRRIGGLENTYGMFTCSLKLKEGSMPYFNHNKFIYSDADVWGLSERCDCSGVLASARVPEDGKPFCQIDLLTPMAWKDCERWQDTTIGRRGNDYKNLKVRMASKCIALAETQLPGLQEAIEETYCSTPLTYRDYNLAPQGTAYGIRKDCNAPLMTILTPRTPIPNLLMTGQNIMVHGLHGVTITAQYTVREVRGGA